MALRPLGPPLRPQLVAATPPTGALQLHDLYGVVNVATSEHFALRWGDDGTVDDRDVEVLLASFEAAWAHQIDVMGHPAPGSTSTHYFNVYVGDTGGGTPGSFGAAGYYNTDADGLPMIVMAADLLWDELYVESTAAHEFYHAVQDGTGRFTYEGLGAWFWEATAEWAALETLPDNPTTGSLLFGYVLLPNLPVNAFDYVDTGELAEYHQYGAFLFPHYLTSIVGYELVRDAWIVPGESDDPLEVVRLGVEAAGHDFDALWLDHAAHNPVFDYPLGDLWEEQVDAIEPWYPNALPITKFLSGQGQFELDRINGDDRVPGRYGYNVISLGVPADGDLEVEIVGDEVGDQGSPASFGARLVRVVDGVPTYDVVPFDGVHGQLLVPDVDAERIYLVVGAWTEATDHWEHEGFPYSYRLWIGAPPEEGEGSDWPIALRTAPEEEEARACGCAATGGTSVGWAALLPILGLLRRQHRQRRDRRR